MSYRVSRFTGFSLLVAIVCAGPVVADVGNLANRIPPGSNAVAYVNVKALVGSKLGTQEKWKEQLADAYATRPMVVPPNAKEVVMASWIEPATLDPVWEVSVIETTTTISMDRIARDEKGFTDPLGGKMAAWTPMNAYYVRLEERLLGVVCPADRQFAARWVAQSSPGADVLSPWLRDAVKGIDAKTHYLFALDLRDAVSEKRVRGRLAMDEFDCLAGKEIDARKLSECVASVKGLALTAEVGDDI